MRKMLSWPFRGLMLCVALVWLPIFAVLLAWGAPVGRAKELRR